MDCDIRLDQIGELAQSEVHGAGLIRRDGHRLVRGRMTIMAKDPVGEDKGLVFAQHDLLDEAGRLVFSCLTRSVYAR